MTVTLNDDCNLETGGQTKELKSEEGLLSNKKNHGCIENKLNKTIIDKAGFKLRT